ncbi:hypothetical protein FUAX_27170 [Fulvitalea axinellae]|uniref:Uncharacterized protein n=1 Tax=Fulvitalea axinellae TaxID=1182444 RepID=A0AAU9DGV9_9BACT|nr:hypothetical protein FUAX_27170 [Fulvitalea axinellae]
MKKIYCLFVIVVFGALLGQTEAVAQSCNTEKYHDECVKDLESQDNFIFIKSFKIDGVGGAKSKIQKSYVFGKGKEYYINVCSGDEGNSDGIVVSLYNGSRKLIGSNYVNGKFYPHIKFPCTATGIYYITYTFEGSKNYCGASVLGFK